MLVPLALLGETGHLLLDQLNAVAAHHFFHIVFALAAFVVFGGFVAHDIHLRGWPAFSWRLHATPSPNRPRRGRPSEPVNREPARLRSPW